MKHGAICCKVDASNQKKERSQSKNGQEIQANKVDSKCCSRSPPYAHAAPTRRPITRRSDKVKSSTKPNHSPDTSIEGKIINRRNFNHTRQQCHSCLTPLTPRAVISDGVSELRKGAEVLKNKGKSTLILPDLKHYAANVMKSLIGKDPRFKEVVSQIGTTRSAIQQTELAHLTPPCLKQKARFMNLASTIKWMSMIAWLLENPDAKARAEISDERMQEKLGWVKQYADDIAVWQECQEVVSASLKFINEQYLFRGAAHQRDWRLSSVRQKQRGCQTFNRKDSRLRTAS